MPSPMKIPIAIGCSAALMMSLGTRAAADDENLLANPGFENGTAPWSFSVVSQAEAAGEQDFTEKHSGEASFRITNASPYEPQVYGNVFQRVDGLRPQTKYVLSAWVKGIGVRNCFLLCGPNWKFRQPLPKGDFDWQKVELEFETEDGTGSDFLVSTEGVTDALWIDDLELKEVK